MLECQHLNTNVIIDFTPSVNNVTYYRLADRFGADVTYALSRISQAIASLPQFASKGRSAIVVLITVDTDETGS